LHTVQANQPFEVSGVTIRPLSLHHGRMMAFGFLFGQDFAYVTDCKVVPAEVIETIRGVPLLVLDALRYREHPAHLTIGGGMRRGAQAGAKLTRVHAPVPRSGS